MKKLILASVLSAFAFSAASAFACDGMKGHEKSSDNTTSSAKKQDKKDDSAKPDQKS
jgi:hypothetical protein